MVSQAQTSGVGSLHQDAGIEADCGVIAFDLHLAVITARCCGVQCCRGQFTVDAVDGRAETDGNLVIECIADSWLEGHDLDVTLVAPVAAGEAFFVISDQAERDVHAQTKCPVIIDRFDVIAHWHADHRNHVTVVAAAECAATVVDVGLGNHGCGADADLFAFDSGHAGRVAEYGACIIG